MTMIDALLPEFDHEMGVTRRVLERIPEDRFAWQPHPKSMTFGRLATHVAEIPHWVQTIVKDSMFEMNAENYTPKTASSRTELLKSFDENVTSARALIASMTDAQFGATWTLRSGGHDVLTLPKAAVFRSFVLNHLIHHRGQLSVYLRLTGAPVPSIYGPSADEQ